MAMRAGLDMNDPMALERVKGAVGFGTLSDALDYLHDSLDGRGLVVAIQS